MNFENMKKDPKYGIITIKYAITNATDTDEIIFQKKIDSIIALDNIPSAIARFTALEDSLTERREENNNYSFKGLWNTLKAYSKRCKRSYYSMLKV